MTAKWERLSRRDTDRIMRMAKSGKLAAKKDYSPSLGLGTLRGKIIASWSISGLDGWHSFCAAKWGDRIIYVLLSWDSTHFDNQHALELAKVLGFAHELPGVAQVTALEGDSFVDALMQMEPEEIEQVYGAL